MADYSQMTKTELVAEADKLQLRKTVAWDAGDTAEVDAIMAEWAEINTASRALNAVDQTKFTAG